MSECEARGVTVPVRAADVSGVIEDLEFLLIVEVSGEDVVRRRGRGEEDKIGEVDPKPAELSHDSTLETDCESSRSSSRSGWSIAFEVVDERVVVDDSRGCIDVGLELINPFSPI